MTYGAPWWRLPCVACAPARASCATGGARPRPHLDRGARASSCARSAVSLQLVGAWPWLCFFFLFHRQRRLIGPCVGSVRFPWAEAHAWSMPRSHASTTLCHALSCDLSRVRFPRRSTMTARVRGARVRDVPTAERTYAVTTTPAWRPRGCRSTQVRLLIATLFMCFRADAELLDTDRPSSAISTSGDAWI